MFDTTCLSHFARAGQLNVLETLVDGRECWVPNEVATEIHRGVERYPALAAIALQSWLMVIELDFPATVATVLYKRQLGGSPQQHLGECAVLAYAKNYGGTAIIDDSAAVEIATSESITVRGTLWLIISGFKSGLLPREAAEALIDQLAETDMRLPCDGAGLFAWAYREGLLP